MLEQALLLDQALILKKGLNKVTDLFSSPDKKTLSVPSIDCMAPSHGKRLLLRSHGLIVDCILLTNNSAPGGWD